MMHALMGRSEKAQQTLELLKETYVPPFMVAILGDNDRGSAWIDKAVEERDIWLRYLRSHLLFDLLNMRSDPRCIARLRKIWLDK